MKKEKQEKLNSKKRKCTYPSSNHITRHPLKRYRQLKVLRYLLRQPPLSKGFASLNLPVAKSANPLM